MNGEYLGDGVYVEHDGQGVWLRAPRETGVGYGPPATASQVDKLRSLGFAVDKRLTARGASKLFEASKERRRQGLCSVKQGKVLSRYGLPGDASFADAQVWLDELSSNGWQPTNYLRAVARRTAEQRAAEAPRGTVRRGQNSERYCDTP